ncbi:MAG TPA: hypothetical protein VE965_04615 [Gammaproteobacteria bacterium]|nr:hypothetical protein [Gammaproteobacteria bacterium]
MADTSMCQQYLPEGTPQGRSWSGTRAGWEVERLLGLAADRELLHRQVERRDAGVVIQHI